MAVVSLDPPRPCASYLEVASVPWEQYSSVALLSSQAARAPLSNHNSPLL